MTGTDWPTRDGSGIRDYVHVWDLARAHVNAIERFDSIIRGKIHHEAINVGTGNGTTVWELVRAFETVTGDNLDVTEGDPRQGDIAGAYTVSTKAATLLDWHALKSQEDCVRDSLAWHRKRSVLLGDQ